MAYAAAHRPGRSARPPIYAPGLERPPLAPLVEPYFPGDVATMASGRILAVVSDGAAQSLASICPDGTVSHPFPADLDGAPVLGVSGDGSRHAVASSYNAWGQRRFYLVTESAAAGCAAAPLLEAMPSEERDLGALTIDRRTVAADDGEVVVCGRTMQSGGRVSRRIRH